MSPVEQTVKSGPGVALQPSRGTMSVDRKETRVKGKVTWVPSVQVQGRTVIVNGAWLRLAAVHDEDWIEGETVSDPVSFVSQVKETGLDADIFTFAQRFPNTDPKYSYHLERDSLAVIPITTFSEWLGKSAKYDVRSAVKKAARLGVVTKHVDFDDDFVKGIVSIYNESPFRQGKPFWHYNKDFETIKQVSSTYLDRSTFIGAYYRDELVGFIKMVKVGSVAFTFHVISMMKHFDKKPTNALIAKAVEICAAKRMSHLVYGNFIYGDPKSSLTEFKRRNGFQEALVPRYYVPLTRKGKVALAMNLHHGLRAIVPQSIWRVLLSTRASLWKLRGVGSKQATTGV